MDDTLGKIVMPDLPAENDTDGKKLQMCRKNVQQVLNVLDERRKAPTESILGTSRRVMYANLAINAVLTAQALINEAFKE